MGWSGVRHLLGRLAVLVRVQTSEPLVALTFDDGPDPVSTPAVAEVLSTYGARATFFVDGPAASAHPEVLRELRAAGHVVALHGWEHQSAQQSPSSGSLRSQVSDIRRGAGAVERPARLYRPPFGHESRWTRLAALLTGYRLVYWSASIQDWEPTPAAELSSRLSDALGPGAIVLLHDRLRHATDPEAFDRSSLVEALEATLRREQGRHGFVTIPELLDSGPGVYRFRRRLAPALPAMTEQQV